MNAAIEAQLNKALPDGFVADLDQYVWLTEEAADGRELPGRPDVLVSPRPKRPRAGRAEGGVAVAAPPAVAVGPSVETTLAKGKTTKQGYVKITTAGGARVLTVIEVVSPSNKEAGADRRAYLAKRNEYWATGVNLVEIDLLPAGDRMPVDRPSPPVTDYYVVVRPAAKPGTAGVWAFGVREPVPVFAVPVKVGVAPVALDLRACLGRAYDDGRYRGKLR